MRHAVLLAALALATVAAPPASAEPACDISGTWSESFGTTLLRVTPGGSVSGNYTWENGTMSGIMDGVFLNGTWREEPTFAAPRDAGTFSWQFSTDCSSFVGTYSYAESPGEVAGSWSGTRVGAPLPAGPACDPTGFWATDLGPMTFARDDARELDRMRGTFSTGQAFGDLQGAMSGRLWQGYWGAAGRDDIPDRGGRFAIEFDARCETFTGTWMEELDSGRTNVTWTGRRDAEPVAQEATPPSAPSDERGHLPGVGEDEDDPLGIPGPGLALLLGVALVAALALGARRPR